MAIFDTGNFQEGHQISAAGVVNISTGFNFQESVAHNRSRGIVFPQVQFSSAIGSLNFVNDAVLLDYIPVPSGSDFSAINNVTAPQNQPGISKGWGVQHFASYAQGRGVFCSATNATPGAGSQLLGKMKIWGPMKGVATTFFGDVFAAPLSITPVSLATTADSIEFIAQAPPLNDLGQGTGGGVLFWIGITADQLPPFPLQVQTILGFFGAGRGA